MDQIVFGVSISLDVLTLYQGLHEIHGKIDDSNYAKNVCKYYSEVIRKALEKSGLLNNVDDNFDTTVNNIEEVKIGLNALLLLQKVYDAVVSAYKASLDMTKFNAFLSTSGKFASSDFEEQLKYTENCLQTLPKGECFASNELIANPLNICFGFSTEYNVSDEDIWQLRNYINGYEANNNCILVQIAQNIDNNSKPSRGIGKNLSRTISEYVNQYINVVLNTDMVMDYLNDIVAEEYNALRIQVESENRQKKFSLLIALGIWAILLTAEIILLLVLKPNFLVPSVHKAGDVWTNIWKCTLTIIVGLPLLFGTSLLFGFIMPKINTWNFVPRGLVLFFLIYCAYIQDLSKIGGYAIPYRVFGTALIILALVITTSDFYSEDQNSYNSSAFVAMFESRTRGRIVCSNIHILLLIPLLLLFNWCLSYLAVPATWVLVIFLCIGIAWNILVLILGARDELK